MEGKGKDHDSDGETKKKPFDKSKVKCYNLQKIWAFID